MPNWLIHLAAAWIIAEIFNLKEYRSVFLLGAVLPDAKTFAMALAPFTGITNAYALAVPVHTPAGTALLSVFTASLFNEKFKIIFSLLIIGALTHFALDLTMYPYYGADHYMLFYPLSWTQFGISLYSVTEYLTPILVILALSVTLIRRRVTES